jgi:hypothetical protein
MSKNRKLILFASILLIGNSSVAQASQAQPLASLLVNVIDREGDAVRTLTKDDFRLKVNGRPATPIEASYSLAPRRIVVLLDMSGSMAGDAGDKRWQIAREAAEDLLTDTPADVRIAFLTFSDQVHDVFDFSQSRNSMKAWLEGGNRKQRDSRIHGRTALFDSILTATKIFGTFHPGDAIYVITDAGDNSSRVREREVRKLLLECQIRLFVFLFAEQTPFSGMGWGTEAVKEIARATGGFVFGVPGRKHGVEFMPSWSYTFDYNERTRQIVKFYTHSLNIQVNGFYTLRFDLPVPPGKARNVSLEIVDGSGKLRNDVGYTYSTALLPKPN